MKKILFGLSVLALVLTAVPRTNGDELSVNLFYDNLSGGSWIETDDYGYGWQPDVASNSDWRPYADGYWAYTDYGWTWIAYEDFGWATYHYGRWAKLADYGWVWFPGSDLEWGPAWVSWRTGGDQIGWAPLPPRGPGIVYAGGPIGGHVDIDFDIGPAYYNFVDIRFIGEPVLRSHIYAASYNVTYVNQTVNVTNITVKNKIVYNYGPDLEVLSRHSARPIQRLKIERETNADFSAAAKSGRLTKVQGDKLMLGAPQRIEKSARQIAPPKVKTKLGRDKMKIERGWSGAGDEKAQAELKQKIKTQDSKNVPPPTEGTSAEAAGGVKRPLPAEGATGATGAAGASSATGAETSASEKGKFGKRGERGKPAGQGSLEAPPAGDSSLTEGPDKARRGKNQGKRGDEHVGGAQPVLEPTNPPAGHDEALKGKGKNKGEDQGPVAAPFPADEANSAIEKPRGKHKMEPAGTSTGETAPGGTEQGPPRGKLKKQMDVPPTGTEPMNPPGGDQGKHKGRGPAMEPPQPATGAAPGGGEQRGGGKQGKRKGAQETPTPAPQ